MKIKKLLPVLCMALGLTMASPMIAGATGNVSTETAGADSNSRTLKEGWNYNSDGTRFYVKGGKKVTGFQWIDAYNGKKQYLYYFQPDGLLFQTKKAGRVAINGKNYYNLGPDGNYMFAVGGWVSDQAYYAQGANKNGELLTSTIAKIGSRYYGFNKYGQRWTKTGRYRLNNNVYYVTSGGYLCVNKWQKIKIGGVTRSYYFNTRGEMTGLSKRAVNGKTYYYQVNTSNYNLQTAGWHKDYLGRTYYIMSYGKRMATGFKVIDGKRYYFNKINGSLYTNRWLIIDKKAYRADKDGVILTGWFTVNSKKYYANSVGARLTGLQTIDGKVYYFNAGGVLQTGWKTIDGKRYYFAPNYTGTSLGMARTGWFNVNTNMYYANADGTLVTGWVYYNGNRYYLNSNDGGAAIKGKTVIIDGIYYTFDSEGRQTNWEPAGSYSIKVDRQRNMVVVYKGNYPVKTFLCSTGLNNATPAGNFTIRDKLSIHELNGPTWGYYCSHITSDILFHSLPGNAPSHYAFPAHKYNLLGQQASQGCIRLRMGDAYWIYTNCPIGTPVTIGDYIVPSSIKKPVYPTIPESLTVDPSDPTDSTNRGYL